jgi:hypothetical protein
MGVCICPVHGRNGVALVCEHIAQDVRSQISVRHFNTYYFVKPGFLPTHFCDDCVQARALPVSGTVVSDDEWMSEAGAARYNSTGICHGCFKQYLCSSK